MRSDCSNNKPVSFRGFPINESKQVRHRRTHTHRFGVGGWGGSRLLADSGSLQGSAGAGFGAGVIDFQQGENNDCGILGYASKGPFVIKGFQR
jgi:hypothetical protein